MYVTYMTLLDFIEYNLDLFQKDTEKTLNFADTIFRILIHNVFFSSI